jgi:hypothetical protein
VTSGARFGRTICLVLGVLSLGASLSSLITSAEINASPDGRSIELCGGIGNQPDELTSSCSAAVQAHAQAAILPAIAGVGWMLGAVAFSLSERRPAAAAPYPAAPNHQAAPGYQGVAGYQPAPGYQTAPGTGAPPPPTDPPPWPGNGPTRPRRR